MIQAAFDYLMATTAGRSPRWPALRRRWLASNPACLACGAKDGVEVHHIFPVHVAPNLELDELNLATFCRPHHLYLAHLGDWDSWNPTCLSDARRWLAKVRNRPYKRPN